MLYIIFANCKIQLFYFSCCPEGSSTLFHSKNKYDSSHNDSYIVCADSAAHRLHADKSRYCTSGDWKTEVLEGESSGMSMRNVDGKAVIQYWGNDTNLKSVYRTKKQEFDVESKHYCVRSFQLILWKEVYQCILLFIRKHL